MNECMTEADEMGEDSADGASEGEPAQDPTCYIEIFDHDIYLDMGPSGLALVAASPPSLRNCFSHRSPVAGCSVGRLIKSTRRGSL